MQTHRARLQKDFRDSPRGECSSLVAALPSLFLTPTPVPQHGADPKHTNQWKNTAVKVAEVSDFDIGLEVLRQAKVDQQKEARARKQGKGKGADGPEKKTTEEDEAKAKAAADELLALEESGVPEEGKDAKKKKRNKKKKSGAKASEGGRD